MKVGIIGLPGSGKWTVFEALTQTVVDVARKGESRIGTVAVPDGRVDALSDLYKPRKTTYAQVQYFLPGIRRQEGRPAQEQTPLAQVRDCDALIGVVRNFPVLGNGKPKPFADARKLDEEMVFADLITVEKRLERIDYDLQRNRKFDPDEMALLKTCRECLEAEVPIRRRPELASSAHLRSYSFLSAKPMLAVLNNGDDDGAMPEAAEQGERDICAVVRGRLEHELAQMSEDEAGEFASEYGITESALSRVIRKSYELLGLISFFTVGPDEVRAWTIRAGTPAMQAAGAIHTDLERGFIRAEVVSYDDLMAAGSHREAAKRGQVRLEGKTYLVQDGDLMDVRFGV